jgi:aminoglycoside phosphotransferase (APT) family kinase protein
VGALRTLADAAAAAALAAREGARLVRGRRGLGACPGRLSDLTPDWVERALARSCPGARVRELRVLDESSGTTDRGRLALAGDGPLPATLFVKLAPRDAATRVFVGALGLGEREVRFYRELAPGLRVPAPRAFHAGFDRATGRFVLLLEDLAARGARFGDVGAGCTAAEAEAVVRALARVHAPLWASPRFAADLAWLAPSARARARAERFVRERLVARAARRSGDLLPGALRDAPGALARGWGRVEAAWAAAPPALLHGDPHLGNLYFVGAEPGFADWQVTHRGDAVRDVAYFATLSLDVETRRARERELLAAWRDALAAAGARPPSPDEAWRRHRLGSLYALCAVLATVGAERLQAGAVARAALARAAAAVSDLDALALVA